MKNGQKKIAAVTFAFLILHMLAFMDGRAFSSVISGSLDLFSQKAPYDGRGWHVKSDSYGPDEMITLYAFVVCNGEPCKSLPVAFHMILPSSKSFVLTSQTNSSGFAVIDFAVMTPPVDVDESDVFGTWLVIAETNTAGLTVEDRLSFDVGWIVELLSARTIDSNMSSQGYFGRGGEVGLEVVLKNLAMVAKNATVAVTVRDELGIPINFFEVRDFEVQPYQKLVLVYFKFRIPTYASTGSSIVSISALSYQQNQSGYPYCPGISTSFYIISHSPVTIVFHDASVISVEPSSLWVELGQQTNVDVVVRNEGTDAESFLVELYFGDAIGGSQMVNELSPYTKQILSFVIDTADFWIGNFTLHAHIYSLIGEADLSDNMLIGDIVEVGLDEPLIVHDIAVVNVAVLNSVVYAGEVVQVSVDVANLGTELEIFNASVSFGTSIVELRQAGPLSPGYHLTLLFLWNTSGVEIGSYQVVASVYLPDDANMYDNVYVDHFVQVNPAQQPAVIHDVAITDIVSNRSLVYIGETVQIHVRVKNKGNGVESFNVLLLCNGSVHMVLRAESLDANSERILNFDWDTSDVVKGTYAVSAYAETVEGEKNTSDNFLANGSINITNPPTGLIDLDSNGVFLLLLLIALLILLLTWFLYGGRKGKRNRNSIPSGWSAWYYRQDLLERSEINRTRHPATVRKGKK